MDALAYSQTVREILERLGVSPRDSARLGQAVVHQVVLPLEQRAEQAEQRAAAAGEMEAEVIKARQEKRQADVAAALALLVAALAWLAWLVTIWEGLI